MCYARAPSQKGVATTSGDKQQTKRDNSLDRTQRNGQTRVKEGKLKGIKVNRADSGFRTDGVWDFLM